MQDKQKTAIYSRMAKADDERLAQQEEDLLKYANNSGYADCVCYSDNGASGLSLDGVGIQSLNNDIQSGLIGTIIIAKLDRITRNNTVLVEWLNVLKKHGVTLISVNDGFSFQIMIFFLRNLKDY